MPQTKAETFHTDFLIRDLCNRYVCLIKHTVYCNGSTNKKLIINIIKMLQKIKQNKNSFLWDSLGQGMNSMDNITQSQK